MFARNALTTSLKGVSIVITYCKIYEVMLTRSNAIAMKDDIIAQIIDLGLFFAPKKELSDRATSRLRCHKAITPGVHKTEPIIMCIPSMNASKADFPGTRCD